MNYFVVWFCLNIGLFILAGVVQELEWKRKGKWKIFASICTKLYMISSFSMLFLMFVYGVIWLV